MIKISAFTGYEGIMIFGILIVDAIMLWLIWKELLIIQEARGKV